LMEEATYEEFDLTQAPKIYIRKDNKKWFNYFKQVWGICFYFEKT
jgi:hypothetical protein